MSNRCIPNHQEPEALITRLDHKRVVIIIQNTKMGNDLTIYPFLVDDDNNTICIRGLENIDGTPPRCVHYFGFAFGMQSHTLGTRLPLDFIDPPLLLN